MISFNSYTRVNFYNYYVKNFFNKETAENFLQSFPEPILFLTINTVSFSVQTVLINFLWPLPKLELDIQDFTTVQILQKKKTYLRFSQSSVRIRDHSFLDTVLGFCSHWNLRTFGNKVTASVTS